MITTSYKKKNIKVDYENLMPKYDKLGASISQAVEMLLDEYSIQYLKVYYRVKESSSFIGKMDRYNLQNPLDEIFDLCGIRIICYYKSDIDKIIELIRNEFNVLVSQDKESLLEADQFGYRSHHLIVKIKESWLNAPNYRGLDNLKAEIQIRTNLMHTWAEIEHKLGYKKKEDIPYEFRRKFSRLSAKLEEADEQFEELKQQITNYREYSKINYLTKNESELNLDILQAFLDDYFPDRISSQESTSELLSDLIKLKIGIPQLKTLYEKCNHLLDGLNADHKRLFGENSEWAQVGIVRMVLYLTVDEFFEEDRMPKNLYDIISEYRKNIK